MSRARDRCLDGVTEQDQRLAGRIEEDGRACVVVVNKWDAVEKDSHTMTAMEKERVQALFPRLGPDAVHPGDHGPAGGEHLSQPWLNSTDAASARPLLTRY